jgi:hypothetical protein
VKAERKFWSDFASYLIEHQSSGRKVAACSTGNPQPQNRNETKPPLGTLHGQVDEEVDGRYPTTDGVRSIGQNSRLDHEMVVVDLADGSNIWRASPRAILFYGCGRAAGETFKCFLVQTTSHELWRRC